MLLLLYYGIFRWVFTAALAVRKGSSPASLLLVVHLLPSNCIRSRIPASCSNAFRPRPEGVLGESDDPVEFQQLQQPKLAGLQAMPKPTEMQGLGFRAFCTGLRRNG